MPGRDLGLFALMSMCATSRDWGLNQTDSYKCIWHRNAARIRWNETVNYDPLWYRLKLMKHLQSLHFFPWQCLPWRILHLMAISFNCVKISISIDYSTCKLISEPCFARPKAVGVFSPVQHELRTNSVLFWTVFSFPLKNGWLRRINNSWRHETNEWCC